MYYCNEFIVSLLYCKVDIVYYHWCRNYPTKKLKISSSDRVIRYTKRPHQTEKAVKVLTTALFRPK